MTRAWLTLAAATASFQATPALADEAAPILGAWAVDVSRLPVPPEARPKSVTMTFSDAGAGKYRTNVDIILADGSESHGSSTYALDGTAAPVIGSPEADVSAVIAPEPDVLVGTVRPRLSGAAVVIERKSSAAWTMVGQAVVDATGAFRAELRLVPGSYRARLPATDELVAGASPVTAAARSMPE